MYLIIMFTCLRDLPDQGNLGHSVLERGLACLVQVAQVFKEDVSIETPNTFMLSTIREMVLTKLQTACVNTTSLNTKLDTITTMITIK